VREQRSTAEGVTVRAGCTQLMDDGPPWINEGLGDCAGAFLRRGERVQRQAQAGSSAISSMSAVTDCFVPSTVIELAVQLPCRGRLMTSMNATNTV
jgi:hypothetical protein